jgi:arylsulfatase A-like enzyme
MPSRITRRTFGASLAGTLGLSASAHAQSRPPNILFLMADDVRADALGFMGHPVVKSPNLDALARGGVALTQCFSAAPAGTPARISALTGRYAHTHGVTSDGSALADGEVLLPQLFAKKGYRTGMVGNFAIHGRNVQDLFDSCQTFDGDYIAFLNEKFPELNGNPDVRAQNFGGQGRQLWLVGSSRLPAQDYPTAWTAHKAIEFVEAGKSGEPWFLFASFRKPQDAYISPLPWPDRYPREQISLPRLPEERPKPPTAEDRDADYITKQNEAALIDVRRAYYGGVSYLDEQIGAIVRGLRKAGQFENTLIVFTSDRGDMLGDLGRMGGGVPYDSAIHVPCMLHYEAGFKITGGVKRVADTTCLAPTILDLAGFEPQEGFESPSAKQILTVVGAEWNEVAYSELGFHAIRTPKWKLVQPRDHPVWEPQLFNLEKDPKETTNLYGNDEAAAAQREMADRLQQWEEAKPQPVKG